MLVLILACSQAPEMTDATTDAGYPELSVPQQPNGFTPPEPDCDDVEIGFGMSLFNLDSGMVITITVLDQERPVYTEHITVDSCGIATPFEDVTADDLWGEDFEIDSAVYALASDPSYYEFVGMFVEEGYEDLPISTQWDPESRTAIRDPTYGINVGPFMIL